MTPNLLATGIHVTLLSQDTAVLHIVGIQRRDILTLFQLQRETEEETVEIFRDIQILVELHLVPSNRSLRGKLLTCQVFTIQVLTNESRD